MPTLMSRESFRAWLLSRPKPKDVAELMDTTDHWFSMMKDGGGNYAEDIRKLGTDYLVECATDPDRNK